MPVDDKGDALLGWVITLLRVGSGSAPPLSTIKRHPSPGDKWLDRFGRAGGFDVTNLAYPVVTGDRLRVRYGGGVGLFVDIRGYRSLTLSLSLLRWGCIGQYSGYGKGALVALV